MDNATLIAEGGVEIEFAGKPRVIYYNYRAFCALEKELQKRGISEALGGIIKRDLSPEITAVCLWAGLLHDPEFKDKSPDDVGEEIGGMPGGLAAFTVIFHQVSKALFKISPEMDEAAAEVEKKARPLARKKRKKRKSSGALT